MKLQVTNIGPFYGTQEIQIDGITILAGLNGSGKSTFGKMLYCIFSSFYHIEERIIKEKKMSIRRLLWNSAHNERSVASRKINDLFYSDNSCVDRMLNSDNNDNVNLLIDELLDQFFDHILSLDDKNELKSRILQVVNLEDSKIRDRIFRNIIEIEFGDNLKNVSASSKEASGRLGIKDEEISFTYNGDVLTVNDYISLFKNVLYIDDPNIADYLGTGNNLAFLDATHRSDLFFKLNAIGKKDISSVDQIIINEKIKKIENKINSVCDGEIMLTESNTFKYLSSDYKEGLNIGNMATGLKSFAVVKLLLKSGYFEENGIVIFDEPEIHLHPEWQKVWAEIIVLLHKEFGINIVLSTHSADFLGFLELYIHKYKAIDKTKLYKLNKNGVSNSSVEDVTNNWHSVYGQLGKPFIEIAEALGEFYD